MTKRGEAMPGLVQAKDPRRHVPVLLAQVLEYLGPREGGCYLDATFGAGGYTTAILDAANTRVIALDRDPGAIACGAELAARFAPRLTITHQPFGDLHPVALDHRGSLDGVVFDLGVSSMQLDEAARGFSFQADGPLDMRMAAHPSARPDGDGDGGDIGPSAADIVNTQSQELIANILYDLGEERRSRAIAAAIVKRRTSKPFERTLDLASVVMSVLGAGRPDQKHPATRTFQALRLYVNDELGQLARGLAGAEQLLKPGGRLVVVSFHSLEDRIVKRFLTARAGKAAGASRHVPMQRDERHPSFQIINSKSLSPRDDELAHNPRARSAKLRSAERTDAVAWDLDVAGLGLPRVCLDA